MVKPKIYYKDEEELNKLVTKYPNFKAEYEQMPDELIEQGFGSPLVCKDKNEPIESCPVGEKYIAKLAKEMNE